MVDQTRGTAGDRTPVRPVVARDQGFTLVEMTTSVAVMLIVMTAAWLLLTTSSDNLNRIDNSGQASELNRAAFASFERDLGHAVLPQAGMSAILSAEPTSCTFLADVDIPTDGRPELITWSGDEHSHLLVRSVKRAPAAVATEDLDAITSFNGGTLTSATVLTGLATSPSELGTTTPMFKYSVSATYEGSDLQDHPALVGLVTFHVRNGLPTKDMNVIDRTNAFRVLAYVINGY